MKNSWATILSQVGLTFFKSLYHCNLSPPRRIWSERREEWRILELLFGARYDCFSTTTGVTAVYLSHEGREAKETSNKNLDLMSWARYDFFLQGPVSRQFLAITEKKPLTRSVNNSVLLSDALRYVKTSSAKEPAILCCFPRETKNL